MKKSYEENLKYMRSFTVPLKEASLYWIPETDCAFVVSDQLRFDHTARAFEKRWGHCYTFLADQCPDIPEARYIYMIEAMQAIVRDGVSPQAMFKALMQIPEIGIDFSEDTVLKGLS